MRLRFLPPCSLRPSLALFLAASLLSSIPVIGRPMALHLQEPQWITHHYEINLCTVLVDSTDPEGKLGTGLVLLDIDSRMISKDPITLTHSTSLSKTHIGVVSISIERGSKKAEDWIFERAAIYARAFEYPMPEYSAFNKWRYLTTFLRGFCSAHEPPLEHDSEEQSEHCPVLTSWKNVVDHALFVEAGDEIALIEYLRVSDLPHASRPTVPPMETALSIAGTVIFHSQPVNPQQRFARKRTIGNIKSGVDALAIEVLYDDATAVDNCKFHYRDREEQQLIQGWLDAEKDWKADYSRKRKNSRERRVWKDLANWKVGEAFVYELNKRGYLTDEEVENWRKIRTTRIPAYIATVRRDKDVANARKPKEGSELNQDAGSSTGAKGDSRRGRGKKPRAA
ncbi:hypothetical protein EV360DRAFT_86329 [Lentinula raphanica]|nr:hypothetical protein EV360DRAFT_86329 [Lentinula raphanica]